MVTVPIRISQYRNNSVVHQGSSPMEGTSPLSTLMHSPQALASVRNSPIHISARELHDREVLINNKRYSLKKPSISASMRIQKLQDSTASAPDAEVEWAALSNDIYNCGNDVVENPAHYNFTKR